MPKRKAFALRISEEILQAMQRWSDDDSWKADFMDISRLSPAHIARLKAQHEQTRAVKTRT